MKIRFVLSIVLMPVVGICGTDVEAPLFALTNEWGKGSVMDFRRKLDNAKSVVLKNGGSDALTSWYLQFVSYPELLEETGSTSWMQEKVEMLLMCAKTLPTETSTNCWFAAAGLLNRYRGLARAAESNANVRVDLSLAKTDPKRFNEIFYGMKPQKIKAWNLRCVEMSLARVVTNVFPACILPSLPESERDKMMSEVLVRAGLASADDKNERPLTKQHLKCVILFAVASSLVLAGCVVLKRCV